MPTTGPIYNLLADRYEGLLKVGLKFPITAMLLAILALLPLWWLATHMETGFMPDMDEGAFVLDYEMPVGTSLAQTDKVMRRVEDVSARHARHLGLHPPDRRRARVSSPPNRYTGDILVSLKPAGQRRPAEEIFEALREELEDEVPELETEFVPLVQDQINDLAGVDSPIEVKVFGPDFAKLRELAEQVGADRREGRRRRGHERPRLPGQSRRRDSARQLADRPRRPDRARHRVPAQRRPLRPGGQHGSRSKTG